MGTSNQENQVAYCVHLEVAENLRQRIASSRGTSHRQDTIKALGGQEVCPVVTMDCKTTPRVPGGGQSIDHQAMPDVQEIRQEKQFHEHY